MYIKKLILYRYKRLFLNNIEKLTYTPESNIQILLGSNGSGKSSVLSMLNPLPAELKRDFDTNGYKYIEISYKNKEYIISSGYVPNKHSFIVDGVELNNGGTKTVQLQLVEEHFRITPYNNSILLGTNKLTTMSGTDRKKVFTEISNVDYTYAISIYNKLKQRHRDIAGSIKILNESLIKTEANLLSKETLDKYNLDIVYLKELITHLTSIYNHTIDNNDDIDSNINKLSNLLNSYNRYISGTDVNPYDNNKLLESKIVIDTKIATITADIENIKKKLSSTLAIPKTDLDIDTLNKELEDYTNKIETLVKTNYINIDLNNIDIIKKVYLDNITTILSILDDLSKYTDVSCKIPDIDKQTNLTDSLRMELSKVSNSIELYTKRKIELLSLKNEENIVTCSNCGNKWYHKYDEKELTNIEATIADLNTKYTSISNLLDSNTKLLSKMKYKLTIINSLKEVILNTPELKSIWNYILNKYDVHSDNITPIVTELNKILAYLEEWSKYLIYKAKIEELNKTKEQLLLIDIANRNNLLTIVDELEKELTNKVTELNKLNYAKEENSKKISIVNKLMEYIVDIRKLLKAIHNSKKILVEKEKNKQLILLVNDLKNILTETEFIVNNNNSIQAKIDSTKKELEELAVKEKVLRLLVKELSPNEGLIAKSINSFLNIFLSDMNVIINSVWSYQMEILPFDLTESEDLDYKFPIRVNNSEVIEDISKLSSSMMEIIDLAFRIVYVKYGNLQHYPLILDEFGRTFDQQHRTYGYDIIDKILSSSFKQIFIVSHFEESYLRFSHGDISILNTTNLDISNISNYNQVLTLE